MCKYLFSVDTSLSQQYSTKSDTQRKALLKTATPSQVRSLGEICQNILYIDLKIDDECREELRKHVKGHRLTRQRLRSEEEKN